MFVYFCNDLLKNILYNKLKLLLNEKVIIIFKFHF